MRNRTKLLVSALIGGASLAAAIPAQAQNYPQHQGRYDDRGDRGDRYRGNSNAIYQQIQQLRQRVERNDGRDRISEREAATLRRAVYNLQNQYRDFNRNGLNQREARVLQERIDWVRERLRYERRDNDGRRW